MTALQELISSINRASIAVEEGERSSPAVAQGEAEMTNRIYEAWLNLGEFIECRPPGVAEGVAGARQLFIKWVEAGHKREYFEPMASAPANVKEAFSVLRAFTSNCTDAEFAEFLELTKT